MIILRGALGNILYSRHTLPHSHCVVMTQFPLGNHDQQPRQHSNSHLCLVIQRHVEPNVAKWHSQLPLQWNYCYISLWTHSSLWN